MPITTEILLIKTNGNNELINLTHYIDNFLEKYNFKSASLNISVLGATASIISIEYEPGLIKDMRKILDDIVPKDKIYFHDKKWDENNAYAYLRASLFGNSRSFIIYDNELQTGTAQQIILIDFDNKPRVRKVILQALS